MTPTSPLTLAELCDAVDVTPRTVRYYIQQGLLPPADGTGQAASYNAGHLSRLRLVKALQGRHLPLAEIRARLENLTDEDERDLLAQPGAQPAPSSAADYIRAVLGASLGQRPPANATYRVAFPTGGPPAAVVPGGPSGASSAQFGSRAAWERYTVSKDVEIHVRRPLDLQTNRRLEKLLEAARALSKENTNEP